MTNIIVSLIKVEPYWNVNGVAIIPPAIDTGN